MSKGNGSIQTAGLRRGGLHHRYLSAFVFPIMVVAGGTATAGEWPTYGHDVARSGISAENLSMPLAERWVYGPCHPKKPAWRDPNPQPIGGWHGLTERRRFHFEDAFHVAVSDNAVYFGSSADGRVVSLDAETGTPRWRALTGGPVRLAPIVCNGNVYFGSDDGRVYCVRGEDGSEVWRFHAAPAEQEVLGSERMISLWPVRSAWPSLRRPGRGPSSAAVPIVQSRLVRPG